VRNRVAGIRGLVRICVVMALVPVALVVTGAVANASASDGVAAASMPFPVGTVGIAVVVVGLGGLVTGLVRHRRREVNAAAVVKPAEQPIVERAA
jgi:hypothetical protein